MFTVVLLASLMTVTTATERPGISLEARDARVDDLARLLLASQRSLEVTIDDDAQMRLTVSIKSTPWDVALFQILRSNGLGFERKGRVFRIARQEAIDRDRAIALKNYSCNLHVR